MNRKSLIQLQLVALSIITIAVLFRFFGGAPGSGGLVVMEHNLEPYRLSHATLEVKQPVNVHIQAVGSFLDNDNLAAYGWIFDRIRREVAWKMSPGSVERKRRTLAVSDERALLQEGTYDVYFASYGDPDITGSRRRGALARLFRQRSERWISDSNRWKLAINPVERRHATSVTVLRNERDAGAVETLLLQKSGSASDASFDLLRVERPIRVHVYALGEIAGDRSDQGRIEHLDAGKILWTFERTNTAHAGGGQRNRVYDGELALPPGTYRITWEPQRSGSGWQVNPPYDASGLGMRLFASSPEEAAAVTRLDPWENLNRFVDLTEAGNNTRLSAVFSVTEELPVVVYATGEGSGRRMYDFGWIYDNDRGRRIWEMEFAGTTHAGGARKNRVASDVLHLEPGTYTASYVTDNSHAYGDWNATRPTHPERWGLALFSIGDENIQVHSHDRTSTASDEDPGPGMPEIPELPFVDLEAIQRQAREAAAEALLQVESVQDKIEKAEAGERSEMYTRTVVDLTRLPDNARERVSFTLERRTSIHIRAVGEIMLSGRYDYGWIEDASGKPVWEMTSENTHHAGGARKNRIADEIIMLPPGTYTVHFKTDDSHAYGSFNQDPPDEPESWGILIRKADS